MNMFPEKKWIRLSEEESGASHAYTVLDPRVLHRGKSYSEHTTDWMGYFLSAYADTRTSGPVVFLRSHGLPLSYASDIPIEITAKITSPVQYNIDPGYPTPYENDPNVRVGNDMLQIFMDQAVFVPIITAYQFASIDPNRDWGSLLDNTGLTIDNGDNPPDRCQLTIGSTVGSTINSKCIELPEGLEMKDFRITTPIFTSVVPEAPYGASVKDFIEEGQAPPGSYPTMMDGYFIMLEFKPGNYWIHSYASAGREERGPYFSQLIYQIDVREKPKNVPHGRITTRIPARNQGIIDLIATKKVAHGQLTKDEGEFLKSLINDVSKSPEKSTE
jgi:hypothetical protein